MRLPPGRFISLIAGLLACVSLLLVPSDFWGDYDLFMIPITILAVCLFMVAWSRINYPPHNYYNSQTDVSPLSTGESGHTYVQDEFDASVADSANTIIDSPDQQFEQGLSYRFGRGTAVDMPRALACFLTAASAGHCDAQEQLVSLYEYGEGVPIDKQKSFEWLTRAAHNGSVDCRYDLATRYLTGNGIPVDIPNGIHWLTRAAKRGDMVSQNELGQRLFYGNDIPQDRKKAIIYIKLSARQGWEDAVDFLKRHG